MVTVSLNNLFESAPERRTGFDKSTTVHVEHFFRDGGLQLIHSVVGCLVDCSLNHAPNKIIQRITVQGAGWPKFRGPVVREVLETPCLRLPSLVSRRRVLLEDVFPSTRHLVHPWLDNCLEDIDVGIGVDSQALWKKSKEALCVLRY